MEWFSWAVTVAVNIQTNIDQAYSPAAQKLITGDQSLQSISQWENTSSHQATGQHKDGK